MDEQVILVNQQDQAIGQMEKLEAHVKGALHRAFSIFILNKRNELLLQRRALDKYHSGGLWTNTCCSHPRPGETDLQAANRRLEEEMGMQCQLTYGFNFIYNAKLDQNLTEHEFDHVFFGFTDELPAINSKEVMDFRYVSLEQLTEDILVNADRYTAWLRICLKQVKMHLEVNKQKTGI